MLNFQRQSQKYCMFATLAVFVFAVDVAVLVSVRLNLQVNQSDCAE